MSLGPGLEEGHIGTECVEDVHLPKDEVKAQE